MLDKRLVELLEKDGLTKEEFEEIEEHKQVIDVETCGIAGDGYNRLFNVITVEDEYNILVNPNIWE